MTVKTRIDTTELRAHAESRMKLNANVMYVHAANLIALLDELDATHEARKEAQAGIVGLHKRLHDSIHQVRIDMRKHIKAAEDDAARYRWLRGKAGIGGLGDNLTLSFPRVPVKITDMSFEHDVDRAIHYAMLAAAPKHGCQCHHCKPVTLEDMRMVLCPDCGNKRCPRANDHRNACTGSNEVGQDGSACPSQQLPDTTCTCPSGDGSLRWPCPLTRRSLSHDRPLDQHRIPPRKSATAPHHTPPLSGVFHFKRHKYRKEQQ